MNNVNLAGKVTRINIRPKVAYFTLCVRTRQKYEYIDITDFSPEFITKYLHEGDYIAVNGSIHVNGAENAYKVEIISDSISLLGKANEAPNQQIYANQGYSEDLAAVGFI